MVSNGWKVICWEWGLLETRLTGSHMQYWQYNITAETGSQLSSVILGSMPWSAVCVICSQLSSWVAHTWLSRWRSQTWLSWLEMVSPLSGDIRWEPPFLCCELFPPLVNDTLYCHTSPWDSWPDGFHLLSFQKALSMSDCGGIYGQWRCLWCNNFLHFCGPRWLCRDFWFWVSSFCWNVCGNIGRLLEVVWLVCVSLLHFWLPGLWVLFWLFLFYIGFIIKCREVWP